MKKITFVIPSRNNLDLLKLAYTSIRRLKGEHEILVLDDASEDGTGDWLSSLDDNNLVVHTNPGPDRVGIVGMFDKGIEMATTDIIFAFHADMVAGTNLDVNILKHLKRGKVVSATRIEPPLHPKGPEKIIHNFGIEPEEFDWTDWINQNESFEQDKTTRGVFAPWCMYKEDFLKVGGHDELFAPQSREDSDLFNRFLLNGYEFIQPWDALVYHFTSRGSRFNKFAGGDTGKDSPEWQQTNQKNMKNFIRKWGQMVNHNEHMLPIVTPKYDIGFVVKNCNTEMIQHLEPWCSTLYLDCEFDDYIKTEQPNTLINLSDKLYSIHAEKQNDIIIEFDLADINNQNFNIIPQFNLMLMDSGEIGEMEFDIFRLIVNKMEDMNLQYQDTITGDIKLKVVVPCYNVDKWLRKNLDSIASQKYINYDVCVVDDCSTDNTKDIILEYCKKYDWDYLLNSENKGAMYNIKAAIDYLNCKDEDVIVTCDGDDWLIDDGVFSALYNEYKKYNCWMTYGGCGERLSGGPKFQYFNLMFDGWTKEAEFLDTDGINPNPGLNKSVPVEQVNRVINSSLYRRIPWVFGQLRTFKSWLWNRIDVDDLKNKDGKYYEATWDKAMMYPMLEMAGGRARCLTTKKGYPKPLYVYNDNTGINDSKTKPELSEKYNTEILQKKSKYKPLFGLTHQNYKPLERENKIVQGMWIGNQLSTLEQLSIKSFLRNGHEYHLYTYGDVYGIPDGVVVKDGNEIIDGNEKFFYTDPKHYGSYSAFSNWFRYKLLFDKGGWWVDTDIICLKPFNLTGWKHKHIFTSELSGENEVITSGVIKAPKGSEVMKYCWDRTQEIGKQVQWGQIGPRLVGEAVNHFKYNNYVKPANEFNPFHYEDFTSIIDGKDFDLSESYSVHLWNEMWKVKKLNKDAEYETTSLYQHLKRIYL